MHKIWLAVILVMGLGLAVRSWNFGANLNFSMDQGSSCLKSLELWEQKKIELLGPPVSIGYDGRNLFHGSITYYFQLVFLLLGKFDPVVSSYLFTVFGVLMTLPLYLGVKMLSDEKKAMLVASVYCLLPLVINGTRFLWNPNFQITLMPGLIWLMGKQHVTRNNLWLAAAGIYYGLLLMFHYQLVVVGVLMLLYFVFIEKVGVKGLLFPAGVVIGFSPMLLFELRNDFYNLRTLMMVIQNLGQTVGQMRFVGHYSVSIFLFLLVLTMAHIKVNFRIIGVIAAGMIITDLLMYLPYPSHGSGMVEGWYYQNELKASQIIREQKLENFNVVNLVYDTKAAVQKYLLKINKIGINAPNYKDNKYLYVISKDSDYLNDPAYEIAEFRPAKLLNEWEISGKSRMYLLERKE